MATAWASADRLKQLTEHRPGCPEVQSVRVRFTQYPS